MALFSNCLLIILASAAKRPGSPSIGSRNQKIRRIEGYVGEDQHLATRKRQRQSLSIEGYRSRNTDISREFE